MKRTIITAAIASAFAFNAAAQAEEPAHASVTTLDLTQQIQFVNAVSNQKIFELAMSKAETGIELKLAKIENNLQPKPIAKDDIIIAAGF